MGKIVPARKSFRSKIYSHISNVDSHIDNVKNSLERLVFSNEKEMERVLLKKRLKLMFFVTVLLFTLAYFLSPKGQAEVATFYPTACLGGWINPSNAEGETDVKTNDDESLFTKENSAVLPKSTSADIYCGNFVGEIDPNTKPLKILVSLSWSKGAEVLLEQNITGESFASSSVEILDIASTTEVSFTLSSTTVSTSTDAGVTEDTGTTTESLVEQVLGAVGDTLQKMFGVETSASSTESEGSTPPEANSGTPEESQQVVESSAPSLPQEETVPVTDSPPPPQEPVSEPEPTSFLDELVEKIVRHIVPVVSAQEATTTEPTASLEVVVEESVEEASTQSETDPVIEISTSTEDQVSILQVESNGMVLGDATTTVEVLGSSTTEEFSTSTEFASTTVESTSTPSFLETALEMIISEDTILEVLYTFDGVEWKSLGKVTETAMKYRTFEIPVEAISSWNDMDTLQIKIQPVQGIDKLPTIYLDGIKVEVLYETPVIHVHPDFARDTILKDEIVDGIRIVTIINSDTGLEEIWYMYLEDEQVASSTASTTESTLQTISTSTPLEIISQAGTSTGVVSSSTLLATTTFATTTEGPLATTTLVKNSVLKNKWFKFEGKNNELPSKALITEIEKTEIEKIKKSEPPNFVEDIIKKIKGSFLQAVFVQVERGGDNELWLYDIENNTQEKVGASSTISVSDSFPFGLKGGHLFWLSQGELILYAYDIERKIIFEKLVPPFDQAKGERAEIVFEEIPWKIIIGASGFSFYSNQTGEVFSDEDSAVLDELRKKFNLDSVLNEEKLNQLDFTVENSDAPETGVQEDVNQ